MATGSSGTGTTRSRYDAAGAALSPNRPPSSHASDNGKHASPRIRKTYVHCETGWNLADTRALLPQIKAIGSVSISFSIIRSPVIDYSTTRTATPGRVLPLAWAQPLKTAMSSSR